MLPEDFMPSDKSAIAGMSLEERCELLEALWASIEADPAIDATPDWHREVIEQRLDRMRTDPQPGYSVEELFKRLAEGRK